MGLMSAMGLTLRIKSPETLARRLQTDEKEAPQRVYVALFGLIFGLGFVLCGLDFRFGWSSVPLPAVIFGFACFVGGYGLFAAVMLQNAFASRVVAVQEGQKLITTGLYAHVRHPMYSACLLLFVPMPLALGSFLGLIPMALFPVVLVLRIRNEEALLAKQLPGYIEYMSKTKCRLIPFVW